MLLIVTAAACDDAVVIKLLQLSSDVMSHGDADDNALNSKAQLLPFGDEGKTTTIDGQVSNSLIIRDISSGF